MKKNVIRLIKDDIKISRLVSSLENINISAHKYYLENPIVIFSLLEIPQSERNMEMYNKMIEQGEDLTKYDTADKIEELAEQIFKQLMTLES